MDAVVDTHARATPEDRVWWASLDNREKLLWAVTATSAPATGELAIAVKNLAAASVADFMRDKVKVYEALVPPLSELQLPYQVIPAAGVPAPVAPLGMIEYGGRNCVIVPAV